MRRVSSRYVPLSYIVQCSYSVYITFPPSIVSTSTVRLFSSPVLKLPYGMHGRYADLYQLDPHRQSVRTTWRNLLRRMVPQPLLLALYPVSTSPLIACSFLLTGADIPASQQQAYQTRRNPKQSPAFSAPRAPSSPSRGTPAPSQGPSRWRARGRRLACGGGHTRGSYTS